MNSTPTPGARADAPLSAAPSDITTLTAPSGILQVALNLGRPLRVPPEELDPLIDGIHDNCQGQSRQATGAAASNLDLYPVNRTFFDALGGDENAYLAARAIRFFLPGIPQVYCVGLLAGRHDMALLAKTAWAATPTASTPARRTSRRHCSTRWCSACASGSVFATSTRPSVARLNSPPHDAFARRLGHPPWPGSLCRGTCRRHVHQRHTRRRRSQACLIQPRPRHSPQPSIVTPSVWR